MSFHGVVAKRVTGSVINKGKSVTLSAATQTEAWRRTEEMADQVGETLKSVVEKKPENIPDGAKELILRFANYLVAVQSTSTNVQTVKASMKAMPTNALI